MSLTCFPSEVVSTFPPLDVGLARDSLVTRRMGKKLLWGFSALEKERPCSFHPVFLGCLLWGQHAALRKLLAGEASCGAPADCLAVPPDKSHHPLPGHGSEHHGCLALVPSGGCSPSQYLTTVIDNCPADALPKFLTHTIMQNQRVVWGWFIMQQQ